MFKVKSLVISTLGIFRKPKKCSQCGGAIKPSHWPDSICPFCDAMNEVAAEQEQQWLEERCPCGHKRKDHYLDEHYCTVHHDRWQCGCPSFGTPTEEWEVVHEVNLGDSPGGFKIYE